MANVTEWMGDRDGPTVTCGDSDIWNAEKIDLWQAACDDAFQDEQLGTKEKFWVAEADDETRWREGTVVSRFFASGIRHLHGAGQLLEDLAAGQELAIRDEPENPQNPRAMLIDVRHGCAVGYIPNWLVDDVQRLRSSATSLRILAERVNPDAPAHLRLLCTLMARMP